SDMVVKIIVSWSKSWLKEENWQAGFTLWELLLVLFLMGLILALATSHFGSATNQVYTRVDLANKERLEGAIQLYRVDVGTYPLRVEDLVLSPMGVSGWRGPYVNEIPINPFKPTQVYQIDAFGQVN
ncbi:MAG TPA: type II secretion system protein GspG, partial [Desulfosporosinus sp.]|nr:type II secretion system protein GspG [Desulfosporosinus sp.]